LVEELSSSVSGDWKVTWTRRLESLRYARRATVLIHPSPPSIISKNGCRCTR
jgi:hypothetical protein